MVLNELDRWWNVGTLHICSVPCSTAVTETLKLVRMYRACFNPGNFNVSKIFNIYWLCTYNGGKFPFYKNYIAPESLLIAFRICISEIFVFALRFINTDGELFEWVLFVFWYFCIFFSCFALIYSPTCSYQIVPRNTRPFPSPLSPPSTFYTFFESWYVCLRAFQIKLAADL